MNEASEWRLALAQRIAPIYAENPNVRAVAVLGSVSRGHADRFSDLELGIFWCGPPPEEQRGLAVERLGGVGWQSPPYNEQIQAWEEEYYLDGVKIDPGHFVVETLERMIDDVVVRYDVSLPKQNTVSAIQHAVPLHGMAMIDRWRAKTAVYPVQLARAMVGQHLSFRPRWVSEMLAERDDFLLLAHNFCAIERQMLLILMGLNRIYYPGHKWILRLLDAMRVAPRDLSRRLRKTLQVDLATATRDVFSLIEETLDLIDEHMPEVGTAEAREKVRQQPHAWDRPPVPPTG